MRIFIDFDDVIFNTKKFIADLVKVFQRAGISEEIFRRYYHGDKAYNPADHIKRIKRSREINFNTQKFKNDLNKLLADTSKYVFNDVERFLSKFSKKDLILLSFGGMKLSFGEKSFQRLKVDNSGVAGYFGEIIISDKPKSSALEKSMKAKNNKRENLYFLDDKISHIEDVKKKYPFITAILVKRKDGRYQDEKNEYCDYEVKNLSKALEVINN